MLAYDHGQPMGGSGYFPIAAQPGTPIGTPVMPFRAPVVATAPPISSSPFGCYRPARRMSAPVLHKVPVQQAAQVRSHPVACSGSMLIQPGLRPSSGSMLIPNDSVPGPPIPVYAANTNQQSGQYVPVIQRQEAEELQESFQLGDEASNIYGTWRAPWDPDAWEAENGGPGGLHEAGDASWPGPPPEEPEPEAPDNQQLVDMAPEVASPQWKEQQFLALLDSLETRVDLMSQMQETRNALSQMPGSPSRPNSSPKKSSPKGDVLDLSQKVAPWQMQPQPIFCELADWVAPRLVLPFSREMCGVNLEISQDGYRAERTKGCRQSVAIGSAPLQITQDGRYFEIRVEETVPGWVGGLGIGIAQNPAQSMLHCAKRMPDKAWRIPKTSVVGYWGCVFLNGSEYRTSWHSDTLKDGAKVGFLVTNDGDILLFVDGEAVVHMERAIPREDLLEAMHPIVDVFAATRVVSLSPSASPPPRPWVVSPAM